MGFRKKLGFVLGLTAMAALAVVPAALAAVVNSDHDMTFKYTSIDPKAGACSFCHIPHKAAGSKLWAATITTGTGWRAELISNLCYSCHGGTTYTGAQEILPFGTTGKHGRDVGNLYSFGDIASGALAPAAFGVPLSTDGDLKCTSCHDVHANENRPFIRFQVPGTFNMAATCLKCHPNRANAAGRGITNTRVYPTGPNGAGSYSQHPTEVAVAAAGSPVRGEAFQATINTVFGISDNVQGIGVGGWNLGGHRADMTATGNMTCATCHAVHGNETANWANADGAGNVNVDLGGYAQFEPLSPNPGVTSAAICIGCHVNDMNATGLGAGPGAAGTRSHPIDTLPATWTIGGTALGAGYPLGSFSGEPGKWGTTGAIVCQSCHDMHYGQPNTSLLRGTIDTPIATSNSNCNACHADTTIANHHPSGVAQYAGVTAQSRTSAFNWTGYTFGTIEAVNGYAFATPGTIVTCGTCHGGSGAHNNTGRFPGLSSLNAVSDMCVECHSTNPSQYTPTVGVGAQNATLMQGSHYVGEIVTNGYKRTAAWTGSALTSKYGPEGSLGSIICESCHTLRLTGGTPVVSNNGAGRSSSVRGTAYRSHVRLLLETAGNLNDVYNASNAGVVRDMCTGCHGASPTGGASAAGTATHPTISMNMTVAATTPIVTKVGTGNMTVTLTAGNLVTCESCHRPHDAAGGSGALILEAVGPTSTKVAGGVPAGTSGGVFDRATGNGGLNYADEAPFCNYCHSY